MALPFAPEVTLEAVCTYIFLPGMVMKQATNFAQYWHGASMLADADGETKRGGGKGGGKEKKGR